MSSGRERLRVVLAVGSLEIGGTERQVVRLACELHDRGHDVTVLVLAGGGPLGSELEGCGVGIHALGIEGLLVRGPAGRIRLTATLRQWLSLLGLVGWLRRQRPDVVHAFLFWGYVLVLPAAWLAWVPLRISGRRNMGTEKAAHRVYPLLERGADAVSHYAVANAQAVADVVGTTTPPEKIRVIPNGIDLPPQAEHVADQPPRAVVVANLIAYKGHADLVSALSLLERPPVVDCYGEGPERDRLERLIEESGLDGVVRLNGKVPDAARFYRDAQFAVLPSHEEGLPNAVMEAMAAGLPVIATCVGGVPELLDHGRTGLLVDPRDPQGLADAIDRLSGDSALRVQLGAEARATIAERYSWRRCVQAHEDLYRGQ